MNINYYDASTVENSEIDESDTGADDSSALRQRIRSLMDRNNGLEGRVMELEDELAVVELKQGNFTSSYLSYVIHIFMLLFMYCFYTDFNFLIYLILIFRTRRRVDVPGTYFLDLTLRVYHLLVSQYKNH